VKARTTNSVKTTFCEAMKVETVGRGREPRIFWGGSPPGAGCDYPNLRDASQALNQMGDWCGSFRSGTDRTRTRVCIDLLVRFVGGSWELDQVYLSDRAHLDNSGS